MFAALAIRPTVSTDRSRTAGAIHAEAGDLRAFHKPYQARTPVVSMKTSASSAALWCCSMTAVDTPAWSFKATWAEYPVMYAGSDARAIAKNIAKLARFSSSLRFANASRNRPSPMMVPIVGTWFSRR
jgi:hypothetical protein